MSRSSAERAPRSSAPPTPDDELRRLIDWAALAQLGFDREAVCFAPHAEDPIFGFSECKAACCDQVARTSLGLCWRCEQFWQKAPPGADFQRFCETVPDRARHRRTASLCRVCRTPGHERPVRAHGLCAACEQAMAKRGQSPDEYVAGDEQFPPATPRPSFGRCLVATCTRFAWRRRPTLCEQHYKRWRSSAPTGRAFRTWCARQRSIDRDGRIVVLCGLAERAQLEVLYGLQRAAETGRRTRTTDVQTAVNIVRTQAVSSVCELSMDLIKPGTQPRRFLTFTADQVTLALATPAAEVTQDDWDLRVFGHAPGRLHFGEISQVWLKETAKAWAAERIDTVETARVMGAVLRALVALSESFRRNRSDGGVDPHLVSRGDLAAFANDLSHLEAQGRLSRCTRRNWMLKVGQFLREARAMGLSRPGGPLAGLPEDVVLHRDHGIRDVSLDEQGRPLPQTVIDQLLDPVTLQLLADSYGPDDRAMVELQARVGRRTGELCGLRWDCLAFDETLDETGELRAAPVLIHDMPKVAVRRYRLPIDHETAEIIAAQQVRVRVRYPDTPTSELSLFPANKQNPRGTKPYKVTTFCVHLRDWVDALPELLGPGGEPYERSDICPYGFRHSFAQRHADSGTPVEVLAALMGHTRLTTTQGYYNVTDKRKRNAVDLLAALQVDRRGERTRPTVQRLLDSEASRDAIGHVAVPFGVCREPTNVKARGQACRFRHQCFGCTHFRSDPSFIPELRAYLARLLADHERLRAVQPELEDWARSAAIPSEEEIAAVRRIIDRCQELLENVAADGQAEIEEAITVMRRSRAQLDASVPVRFLGRIGQSTPTLFPNVRREHERGTRDDT